MSHKTKNAPKSLLRGHNAHMVILDDVGPFDVDWGARRKTRKVFTEYLKTVAAVVDKISPFKSSDCQTCGGYLRSDGHCEDCEAYHEAYDYLKINNNR